MSNKALLERAEREQKKVDEKKAKHKAEIQRLAAETEKRMKAEAAERRRHIEEVDKQRAERFEAGLEEEARALFFAGNFGAGEEIWKSVREEYRKKVLLARSEAAAGQSHSLYKW